MAIIKILAPLTYNPNAPDEEGKVPIHETAWNGHTEIVKILAPNEYGNTPIHWAAYHGHIEIVKILSPLTDNPNTSNDNGYTPIYWAALDGSTEIIKILAPLTDNPNQTFGPAGPAWLSLAHIKCHK